MTWQVLPPINLNEDGAYVPLPLAGAGGRVPLQIPPFAVGERGLYEVGIYDLPQGGPPGLVAAAQTAQIAAYTRSLVFEVPPSIAAPHVGIRLISHEDLETATYSVAVRWQIPYGSGTGDGGGTPVPSGFLAAVSWAEIKASAIAEIAQGYATVESVSTQLAEIQEAIDVLSTNTATQQAIAALATRINALESSDPEQASAITALQQSISALAASGATDAELAAGLAAIQSQLADLASDSELSGAIAPIQSAIAGLGGTYATDAELAAAIATETTARQQAIAAIVPSGSDGNLLQRLSNGVAAIANLIYAVAGNLLTLPGGISIRPSLDSATAVRLQNASGSASIATLNTTNGTLTLRSISSGYGTRPFAIQNSAGGNILQITEDGRSYFGGDNGLNAVVVARTTDSKIPLVVSDSSGNALFNSGSITSSRNTFSFGANNFGSAVEISPSNNFIFSIKGTRLAINSGSPVATPSPAWIYARGDSNAVLGLRLDNSSGSSIAVITATGGFGTADTVANSNTPAGPTVRAMRVYNESGGLIGFVPIYQNQW